MKSGSRQTGRGAAGTTGVSVQETVSNVNSLLKPDSSYVSDNNVWTGVYNDPEAMPGTDIERRVRDLPHVTGIRFYGDADSGIVDVTLDENLL